MVEVRQALVTPFDRGTLNAVAAPGCPRSWMTGAVYDSEGRLVKESQRLWAGDPLAPVAVDPDVLRVRPGGAPTLEGTWRYAGHWRVHFGHFFIEALTNLWGAPAPVDGLLFHRSFAGKPAGDRRNGLATPDLVSWQRDLLTLAGYGDVPIRIARHRATYVEHLQVPSRPLLLKSWAGEEAVGVWRRISAAVGTRGTSDKVFLSRRAFHQAGRSKRNDQADAAWDRHLDETFARHGFEIVYPETLSIAEQLTKVRGAGCLAGSGGSALHLSAYADAGTKVLEIGDARSPNRPLPTQRMIDAACGHRTNFVPYRDEAALLAALGDAG